MFGPGPHHVHGTDYGPGRALAAPSDQVIGLSVFALQDGLNGAVARVADPASKSQFQGLFAGGLKKAHAVNIAVHGQVGPNHHPSIAG